MTFSMIRQETKKYPTLAQMYDATLKGWRYMDNPVLAPFYAHKDEITIYQGCVMQGICGIILRNCEQGF